MEAQTATEAIKKIQDLYTVDFYEEIILKHIARRVLANKNELELNRIFGELELYRIAPEPNPLILKALENRFVSRGYTVDTGYSPKIKWDWPSEITISRIGEGIASQEGDKKGFKFTPKSILNISEVVRSVSITFFFINLVVVVGFISYRGVDSINTAIDARSQSEDLPMIKEEVQPPKQKQKAK